MIKSIDIKDFQSHEETHIDFDPGVNVIIGRSDSGKTAILRALNWVINNKPSGEAFMRHDSRETSVTVGLDSGMYVTRQRKGKESLYQLGNKKDHRDFRAFGQDVPEEIKSNINFGPLNIQRQMDAPFLLSFTPGEVGRLLNEIVRLDHIDSALKKANRLVRDTGIQLRTEERRLEDLIEQGKELSYISDLETDLDELEKLNGRIKGIVEKEQSIRSISATIESIDEDLGALAWAPEAEIELDKLDARYQKLVVLQKDHEDIGSMIEAIEDMDTAITAKKDVIEENGKELKKIMPKECPLCGKSMQ